MFLDKRYMKVKENYIFNYIFDRSRLGNSIKVYVIWIKYQILTINSQLKFRKNKVRVSYNLQLYICFNFFFLFLWQRHNTWDRNEKLRGQKRGVKTRDKESANKPTGPTTSLALNRCYIWMYPNRLTPFHKLSLSHSLTLHSHFNNKPLPSKP